MVDLLEWAADRPLFTLNDAARAVDLTRGSLQERLSRMTKRGDLYRVERGKYTIHEDSVIYATYVETPSYLTLWSGLRFYDLTTQLPTQTQVMTAQARRDLDQIQFFASSNLFGFGRHRYEGFEIFVADPERLLLDCLSRKGVPVSALHELIETVEPTKCVEYADRFGRNAVTKRVGYLLEHWRDVREEELLVKDRNYPPLDLNAPCDGTVDTEWRLEVNVDVDAE